MMLKMTMFYLPFAVFHTTKQWERSENETGVDAVAVCCVHGDTSMAAATGGAGLQGIISGP
jgi:hypothetical protein